MKSNSFSFFFFFFFSSSLISVFILNSQGGEAYKNYTVGDSLGWFDNLDVPGVNYQQWAAAKPFSLGDFLIFNTDKNHSVVQTYNETTYNSCDYNDADDDDTTEWSAGEPAVDNAAVTVPVPLLKEGPTYFFSGDYDGEQCEHGQRFAITVAHGKGLPPSLRPPSESSPAPNAADAVDDVPDTVVSSNFNHPKGGGGAGDGGDNVKATSEAGEMWGKGSRRVWLGLLVALVLGDFFGD